MWQMLSVVKKSRLFSIILKMQKSIVVIVVQYSKFERTTFFAAKFKQLYDNNYTSYIKWNAMMVAFVSSIMIKL